MTSKASQNERDSRSSVKAMMTDPVALYAVVLPDPLLAEPRDRGLLRTKQITIIETRVMGPITWTYDTNEKAFQSIGHQILTRIFIRTASTRCWVLVSKEEIVPRERGG
jgi:hypothetical protein